MGEGRLYDTVLRLVLSELARQGDLRAPVNASNRHIHLSRRDIDALFTAGYQLTRLRDLVQPGQFACKEQVTMETDAGSLSLRVVGPERKETQIELSMTEAVRLKIKPVVRLSGDIADTPGCRLLNGDKRIRLERGVIVAARHLHISPQEALVYGVRDGDAVSLSVPGPRGTVFENVIIRSGPGHLLEAHIDREEANACSLTDGQLCSIMKPGGSTGAKDKGNTAAAPSPQPGKGLLLEDDIRAAIANGHKAIRYGRETIVTPLARDAAWENNIELILE